MRIVKEKFKTDKNNELYWGRVYFISDNRKWKTKIIWGASFEFVRRCLGIDGWKNEDVDKSFNKFIMPELKAVKLSASLPKVLCRGFGTNTREKTALADYLREKEEADRHG